VRIRRLILPLVLSVLTCGQERHPGLGPLSYHIALPSNPFGIVTSGDGAWVYVGLTNPAGNGGIAVVRKAGAAYALDHVVPLSAAATGLAITHDGSLLVAAAGSLVFFLTVNGGAVTLAGVMSDGVNAGSVWASVTAGDRWVFVCDENTGQLTVIDLNRARANGFAPSAILGTVLVGSAPTATVFSPDGVWAYTTVEIVSNRLGWAKACIQEGQTASQTLVNPPGAVVVIRVSDAVSNPVGALTSAGQFVPAGCSPVRLALSPDGLTMYVTARNSNAVLALDTTKFASDPLHAEIGRTTVGIAPVPVAWIDGGARIVVGNSNRFLQPGIPQSLNVVDAAGLRKGGGPGTLIGTVPAGAFPRTLTLTPDGRTLLLANYDSNTLQVLDAARLGVARW
jgi:DNA-binding beta-propeller fold protein YncE